MMENNKREFDLKKLRFDAFLIEYNQMYDQFRDYKRTMTSRENLFLPLSFGILAYTVAYEIDFSDLIVASFSSISIFIYYLFSCERALQMMNSFYYRCAEIEKEINSIVEKDCVEYQNKETFYQYRNDADVSLNIKNLTNPLALIKLAGLFVESRRMRLIMLLVLIVLWIFRIV